MITSGQKTTRKILYVGWVFLCPIQPTRSTLAAVNKMSTKHAWKETAQDMKVLHNVAMRMVPRVQNKTPRRAPLIVLLTDRKISPTCQSRTTLTTIATTVSRRTISTAGCACSTSAATKLMSELTRSTESFHHAHRTCGKLLL